MRLATLWLPVYYSRRIALIPDELLAMILEQSTDDPKQLRLVSKRFHRIVSNLPRLWSKIHYGGIHHGNVELALRLSRDFPLDLQFFDRMREHELAVFTPYLHRTGSLWIDCVEMQVEKMHRYFSSLQMERLHFLQLQFLQYHDTDDDNEFEAELPENTFYEDWYTPSLTILDVTNIVPRPIRGMVLKQFSISLLNESLDVHLDRLSAFLEECPGLEDLTIAVSDFRSLQGDAVSVKLFRVKRFQLAIDSSRDGAVETVPLYPIIDALILPNVAEVIVSIRLDSRGSLESCLATVFPTPARYPALQTLDITIESPSIRQMSLKILHTAYTSFPLMQRLTIESQTMSLDLSAVRSVPELPPSLHTVCFRRCYRTGMTSFGMFAADLRSRQMKTQQDSGEYDYSLPTTVFVGCSHLQKSVVIELWTHRRQPFEWYDI